MGKEKAEYEISLKDLFSKPIGDAGKAAGSFENSVKHASASASEFFKGMVGFEVLKKGLEIVKDFASESLHEFMNMETAMVKLNGAISINGGTAAQVKELKEQAEALQQVGIFSDDDLVKGESIAAQFGFNAEQIKKMMPVIADVAAATGKSIDDVMSQVQAGTMGMGRTLKKEFGILVEDTGSKSKNLENTLTALKGKFEGMNQVIAETTEGGKLARMKHQFEDIKEEIGGGLFKVFDKLYPVINAAMGKVSEFFKSGIIDQGVELMMKVYNFMKPIIDAVVELWGHLWGAIMKIWNALKQFAPALMAVFRMIRDAVAWLVDKLSPVFDFLGDFIATIIDVLHTIYVFLDKIGVFSVIGKIFSGIWWVIKKVGEGLKWIYDHTLKYIFDAIGWAYGKIKGLLGIKTEVEVTKTEKSIFEDLSKGKESGFGLPSGANGNFNMSDKTKADGVSGQKSTIINVNIGKLVETIKLTSATMTQGIGQIKEDVAKALIEAVNDSQIIAGG